MLNRTALLTSSLVQAPTKYEKLLLDKFGAQIGELAWHSTHYDPEIEAISERHAKTICRIASDFRLVKPRILEVGAYAHFSAPLAAAQLNGRAWAHDISPDSLKLGKQISEQRGLSSFGEAVAGDFHDLPFEDNMFDIVFIASAVHHTWRPQAVIDELARVTRPGGVVHLENEPVAREACLYAFRGNRPSERTEFEKRLEELGLTHTVSSPFPGSRAEALFGIIENDRIPLSFYQEALARVGDVLALRCDSSALVNIFEGWLLQERPRVEDIAARLIDDVASAAELYCSEDAICDLRVPTQDELWLLAYRIAEKLKGLVVDRERDVAQIFGAALTATVVKVGVGSVRSGYRRDLMSVDEIFVDNLSAHQAGLSLIDVAPGPLSGVFAPDWVPVAEDAGHYSLCNQTSDCVLQFRRVNSILALRIYSVFQGQNYVLSVVREGKVCYRHRVARSESHLAIISVGSGDHLSVHMHLDDGTAYSLLWGTRIVLRQVECKSADSLGQ